MKDISKEIFERIDKEVNGDINLYNQIDLSLYVVDEKYNGIIFVLGELMARGELSEKIYLKALKDLNLERESIKDDLEKLRK